MKEIKTLLFSCTVLMLIQACGSPVKEAELPVRKACNLERLCKPIFKPAHYEMGDPGLLTGAMRAYYEALHWLTSSTAAAA